ncbi:MAG: transcriptional regulator [Actinomycetota bacterium]|nr:transcriptional regulator [Actinomycetota bacterium]
MPNQWLAIDTATPPVERAREVRRAWERFIDVGRADDVRAPIADSWERSQAAGVDPSGERLAPVISDVDETEARWRVHPLATAEPLIRACLAGIAGDARHLMVISDADGTLLWIDGDPAVRRAAADSMHFVEGTLWSESGTGTNAIGTALAADHAVQVYAAEHFHELVQTWTCAAAPIHDPETGDVLGIVDLTSRMTTVHPHSFAVAVLTAEAVEAQLRCRMLEHDALLRRRFHDRVVAAPGPRALARASGRIVLDGPSGWPWAPTIDVPPGGGEFTLPSGARAVAEPVDRDDVYLVHAVDSHTARHRPVLRLCVLGRSRPHLTIDGRDVRLGRRSAEILALLALRPAGMDSDELGIELYGDEGRRASVRVEVSRLRKLVGPCIETQPYRLAARVDCDAADVRALLDHGAVQEATERYTGCLLADSEAPGIVRERDELDGWLRQAVMSSDDPDVLWAWLRCPSGEDDLSAWKRLLARLDFLDPRRSLAVARAAALRGALAQPT